MRVLEISSGVFGPYFVMVTLYCIRCSVVERGAVHVVPLCPEPCAEYRT